jgi:transposase
VFLRLEYDRVVVVRACDGASALCVWVVERTFGWLHHFKRLLVRYDRRHEIHHAFLAIACCLICYRRLENSF